MDAGEGGYAEFRALPQILKQLHVRYGEGDKEDFFV